MVMMIVTAVVTMGLSDGVMEAAVPTIGVMSKATETGGRRRTSEAVVAGAMVVTSVGAGRSLGMVTPCGGVRPAVAAGLSGPGVISTPSLQGWTSPEESVGLVGGGSPRSVLEYFLVSISPVVKGLPTGPTAVESVSLGMGQDFACFRSSCRKPISPVLGRPVKQCRKKKVYLGPVRRSRRIRGRFAQGTPIRQQQRTLMTRLGIAREGEVIGDDALDAYLDLFARPFRQQHLDVVLHLFGWTSDDLLTASDAPVECRS
ncbi:hypothetical protein ACQ4PT_058691 [Festuca glaucescens]